MKTLISVWCHAKEMEMVGLMFMQRPLNGFSAVIVCSILLSCGGDDSANQGPIEFPNGMGSATLSWTAPTQNDDGLPLTDLAGYKFLWGTTPGVYPNSVTINNPGITIYVIDNLSPGTYQFVAIVFNAEGVESIYSEPATLTIPQN